jgi:diguanylate cyclase (GGDEF)-like protein
VALDGDGRAAPSLTHVKTGSPRPNRQLAEDHPIRRTWWLLSGAFVALALITGLRAVTSGDLVDWLPVVAVGFAAVAAYLHRNAVAGLEARGRAEVESFARLLQGLSRSVSVDAIVGAIVDDLAEGTGADHVVVVRRRPEGEALEATLVTRRPGVPSSTTVLPLTDLDAPLDRVVPAAVAVPVVGSDGEAALDHAGEALVAAAVGGSAAAPDAPGGTLTRRDPLRGVHPAIADVPASGPPPSSAAAGLPGHVHRETEPRSGPGGAAAGGGAPGAAPGGPAPGAAGRLLDATASRLAALLDGLGIGHPFGSAGPHLAPRSEVMGSAGAAVTARIADRVRSVYGLTHTLAAPLRTDDGVIGAIVLSRRDREPWPDAARRLLEGAAVESAAAMARAYSYREVAAHASTDPLTGLPNRRYFDEFCGLLARRRRAGDAVAVLMVDIDKFKVLNDTYGHPVGDEVLKAVAGAIVTAVREEDVPARVGGEEFAVLLRNPGPDVAVEVGERVRTAVRELDLRRHGVSAVSVSVGVANANGADEPIPEIVERADRALLRAKRAGRDRVVAA